MFSMLNIILIAVILLGILAELLYRLFTLSTKQTRLVPITIKKDDNQQQKYPK